MNGYAWAAIGVTGAGVAVYAATAIRDRRRDDDDTAPHDRVRLPRPRASGAASGADVNLLSGLHYREAS